MCPLARLFFLNIVVFCLYFVLVCRRFVFYFCSACCIELFGLSGNSTFPSILRARSYLCSACLGLPAVRPAHRSPHWGVLGSLCSRGALAGIRYALKVLKEDSTFFWITFLTASISVEIAFSSVSSCLSLSSRSLSCPWIISIFALIDWISWSYFALL